MSIMSFEEYKRRRVKLYESKFETDNLCKEVINELNRKLEECLENNTPYLCFRYKVDEDKNRKLFLNLSEYLSLLGYNVTRVHYLDDSDKYIRIEFDLTKSKYYN